MEFESLIKLPESKTLEFKRDMSSLLPILKTVVAFANTAGGIVVIGYSVEEKAIDGRIARKTKNYLKSLQSRIKPFIPRNF